MHAFDLLGNDEERSGNRLLPLDLAKLIISSASYITPLS
uniref:Uncharacterized protein n=1 Tax=Arundo donax TaxID=35708 RepID=A0A0A8Z5P1_ARUDO